MISALAQPGILAPVPAVARSVAFRLLPDRDLRSALTKLRDGFEFSLGVAGIAEPAVRALGRAVPGLRAFPALAGPGTSVPATQAALWFFLRGSETGAVFDATTRIATLVEDAFELDDALDAFVYAGGRDLTGYEDGTENPKGDAAVSAALATGAAGFTGSSFVAVQRWLHDLRHFRSLPRARCDAIIGRRFDTNEEIADAPISAHVKRTAQESFDPPAFVLRRSMPWISALEQGLEFIAFGESLDRYERILRRMVGLEDGVPDALFSFSRPLRGGYYWCPPVVRGRLDLSLLGL
jgi:putative iron-dependent peroxidase